MWTLDPAVVVLLTDGGMMMDGNLPTNELILPAGSSYHGSELYREPFRWDQRLYVLLLKFTGANNNNSRQHALAPMAQATGGSCHTATSMRHLIHALDTINNDHSSRKPVSVALEFEPSHQPSSMGSSHSSIPSLIQRVMVRNTGLWPIPEDYTLNATMNSLPPRVALPKIVYKPIPVAQTKPPSPQFPIDVYDLEPSPLVDWINENVPKGYTLECIFGNSRDQGFSGFGGSSPPFALLLPAVDGVKLLVMPYNFPQLFTLLMHYQSRATKWKTDFEKYLGGIPPYYVPPLKTALKSLPMPASPILSGPPVHPFNLILDTTVATCKELPTAVNTWLNEMKERAQTGRASYLAEIAESRKVQQLSQKSGSFSSFLSSTPSSKSGEGFHRSDLLLQIDILRSRLQALPQKHHSEFDRFQTHHDFDDESKHHVPISEMGDFQTYLAKQPRPLRTIDGESTAPGKPYFGNPFTKGEAAGAFVDEVGVSSSSQINGSQNKKKRKRKFGIGERADKFKQFMITEPSAANQTPSGSSNSLQQTSPTTHSLSPSASGSPSAHGMTVTEAGTFAAPPSTSSKLLATSSSSSHSAQTQSFIQQQKSRKEQLQKWEKAHQANTSPRTTTETPPTPIVVPELSPLSMLSIIQGNNALKFNILSAINRPNAPDEAMLKQCQSELKGTPEIKDKSVREWIYLASMYHVDITPFFNPPLV
jgi:integrator complex subunit 6